ncbi:MAG: helix-turn-helix transcriptional regulator [Microvirga sp.]
MAYPCFNATASRRCRVERLASKGMSQREIALLIGCSHVTLAKYFRDELDRGHAKCKRDIIALMRAAAEHGKVGAMIWLERRMREAEATAKPLGKKAQAYLDTQSAGENTAWGDLLRPQPPPKAN